MGSLLNERMPDKFRVFEAAVRLRSQSSEFVDWHGMIDQYLSDPQNPTADVLVRHVATEHNCSHVWPLVHDFVVELRNYTTAGVHRALMREFRLPLAQALGMDRWGREEYIPPMYTHADFLHQMDERVQALVPQMMASAGSNLEPGQSVVMLNANYNPVRCTIKDIGISSSGVINSITGVACRTEDAPASSFFQAQNGQPQPAKDGGDITYAKKSPAPSGPLAAGTARYRLSLPPGVRMLSLPKNNVGFGARAPVLMVLKHLYRLGSIDVVKGKDDNSASPSTRWRT